METSVKITLIIVGAIVILAGVFGLGIWALVTPGNDITVTGESNIKAVPDLVGVYFTVEMRGATAQDAKNNNSEIVNEVVTKLAKIGFEREALVTESFNVYEEFDWVNGKQKSLGYKATHSLKIELPTNESEKIGQVIDAGVDGGAMISYINFELSKDKENIYKAQALKEAGEDAKIKADAMAAGIGKKVVDIKSISESNFNYYPWRLYESAGMAPNVAEAKVAATTIQPGEQDVSAQVSVIFKLG